MLSGALLIDKPKDITSHDAVYYIRKLLKPSKIKVGHTGTLDPFATGLLIIAIGPATRLIEYTHNLRKTYQTEFTLGATSDTDDITGKITQQQTSAKPTIGAIKKVIKKFTGKIKQIPPAYSAVKIAGERSYKKARAGETVKLESRGVIIHNIQISNYKYPKLNLEITCSTGTYIRAITRDLGKDLGIGAYTSQLRRTSIGMFHIKHAIVLPKLSTANLPINLLSPERLMSHLPQIDLKPLNVAKLQKGQNVELPNKKTTTLPLDNPIAVFSLSKKLIGTATISPHQDQPETVLLQPQKILPTHI